MPPTDSHDTGRSFQVGEQVLRYRAHLKSHHGAKFEPKWAGPFWIHEGYPNHTYRLRDILGNVSKGLINGDLLKPLIQRLGDESK